MAKKLTKAYYLKGWRTIVRYLKPHRREVMILAILSMVAAVGSAVTPYLAGKLFDAILGTMDAVRVVRWSVSPFVAVIGAWLFARLLTDIAGRFQGVRQERLTATLEADYLVSGFSKLLRLPVGFHKQHKIGETTERIRRASGWLEAIVNRMVIDLAPEFFSIVVAIAITFTIKPLLAGLLVAAVAVYAGLLVRIAPALSERARAMHRTYSAAYGDAHDTVMNFQAVKQATAERYEQRKLFRNFHLRAVRIWEEYIRIGATMNFWQRILVTFTQTALFVISIYLIRRGQMTIGELAAFNGYAAMLFGPFVTLGRNWELIQNGLVAIERAEEILRKPEETYTPENAVILTDLKGAVEFRDVTFRYGRNQTEVLRGVSFAVESGQSLAFVGESGVGKTTLVELISFYHRPAAGTILVDGHNLSRLDLAALRSFIAVVPQEVVLFNDTIKNNIRYGRFGASDDEVAAAARLAHADEFIERFPKQYDQVVGERGIKLSTGQKQRIAIARAVLRNPRILILDEPTSALDAKSEQFISESLERLMEGRTTFIIAHRLSTVRKANRIIVLEKGKIVEQGKHEELIAIDRGRYRRLYELQIGLK